MNPAIANTRIEPIQSSWLLVSIYFYLQVLDLMTTTVFLANGIEEANPMLRFFMQFGPSPILGLAFGKALGVLLGVFCWKQERLTLLARANVFFGLLVMWNLFAMLLRAYGGH
ncbi:MAG: DUF5658 family protein [Bryobacteraceae bacterium]|nr:DUF5658 family protein [Bryobacteraceae bacterium]